MKTILPLLAGASLAAVHTAVLADDHVQRPLPFSIERQNLGDALDEWAAQSGHRIGWRFEQRIEAPEVKGDFTPQAALERLLDGTSLTYKWLNPQFVVVHDSVEVEEVIVTGTHIPGLLHSASPFTAYQRSEIDVAGWASVQGFLQSLPQNFAGGASENTVLSATGAGNSNNVVQGSGANLRGLGNDATLVLLNGHRIAPGNISGNFVDVSMIPLSAVDRIDVLTDSAAAIYGSDAVAGVVNIIPRRTFDGAETSGRHGFVADGNSTETMVAQALGKQSDDWSVLVNYDYYYRSPLYAGHRSYARGAGQPITLLPKQSRGSFYIAAERSLSSNVSLFADGLYAHRSSYMDMSGCICSQRRPTQIDAYTGTVGARIDLPRDWHLEVTLGDSVSDTHQQTYRDAALVTDNRATSSIRSVEARLDGSFWSMPGGTVRHAIGVQVREETFDIVDEIAATAFDPRRQLTAGYAELRVPLTRRLELSVSGRGEHYSDFGSTFNPQMGIVWTASATLTVRGTYGTAFKAPLLNDLNPRPRFPAAVSIADPTTGGSTPTLFVFGGNPDLEPERATTWTAGFDWQPAVNWKIGATYYDIRITDRIVDPSTYVNLSDALQLESILGPVIQRAPASDTVRAMAASPEFGNYSGDLADIEALVDSRVHNMAVANTRGIDLKASFGADVGSTTIQVGIDATYILDFNSRLAKAAAGLDLLNTPYNPIDLKARARLRVSRGGFSFDTSLHYVDSYADARSGIAIPVSSWTTADVTLGYEIQSGGGLLDDISMTAGIRNLTDEDPPFVRNPGILGIHYDGANADPLGRFYWLGFSKRW